MLRDVIGAIWRVIDFLQTYNGAVTAIATVFIGIFTLVLAQVTGRQAKLSRESIALARDEFIASHRPKIIVHSVELAYAAPDDSGEEARVGAKIIYFNVGDTPARITEINAKILIRKLPFTSGLGLSIGVRLTNLPAPEELIESGHPNVLAVFSDQTLENVRFSETVGQSLGDDRKLICIGQIIYEDSRRVRRETGFCRCLDTAAERWLPVDNPEYEYSY